MSSRRDEIIDLAKQLFARNAACRRRRCATSQRSQGSCRAASTATSRAKRHSRTRSCTTSSCALVDEFRAVEATSDNALERLRALLRVTIRAIETDPAALSIYRRDYQYLVSLPRFAYLYELHIEIRTIWLAAIEVAMAEGYLRNDVDPVVFYRWVRDALTFTPRWHRAGEQPTVDQLTTFAERVFLDGMALKPRGD